MKGRGATDNPANRFERLHVVADEWVQRGSDPSATDPESSASSPETVFYRDASRTILAKNDSPDVGFDVSINPYRGCEHGCIYCYARPTHEYLGFSAGLDFETRIMVKEDAALLLRERLLSPRWTPQPIAMSGVTDPYQPVERKLRITRSCLEVLAEFRNPVSIITKNHLVTRDVDVLSELAKHDAAAVAVSVTTLRPELQRVMEPRTATPTRRLDAIRTLSDAGIPVRVMVAPVIPGLTDSEIPAILDAAAEAGARHASYIMMRLPHGVKGLFAEWLEARFPDRRDRVLNRVREVREGRLNDPRYGSRMRGQGVYAEHIRQLFETARRRVGLAAEAAPLSTAAFRRPPADGQMDLFGD
ncbi:MAG: PA0069 family radical SAM protein [Longimicrobiales bacterium]|nr:PA0069 family radical SAM protein [Longimicrobiales bacterium]